jgi:hypothetical protein
LLTIEELIAFPPGEWLIEEMMQVGSLGVLYGQPGVGKSFLALDWALSISVKEEWQGKALRSGPVVYVASEGHSGLRQRVKAWMDHNRVTDMKNAFVMLHPVQLRTLGDVDALLAQLDGRNLKPRLIVFDTLAGCFVGGEENSAKDMGELLDGVRRLQEATESAVLLIHHTGKNGDTERGSSALRGAADVMMMVTGSSQRLALHNTKQKEAEPFKRMGFALHRVVVGVDAQGREVSSAVVVAGAGESTTSGGSSLNRQEFDTLLALYDSVEPLTPQEWWTRTQARVGREVPRDTFDKWCKPLRSEELVRKRDDGRYVLTEYGEATAIGAPATRPSAA